MTQPRQTRLVPIVGTLLMIVLLMVVAVGVLFFADDTPESVERMRHRLTQKADVKGNWLGMKLSDVDSKSAREWGVPTSAEGVLVTGIHEGARGWRARQAGVQSGDLLFGISGKKVTDMHDILDVSQKLDIGGAVLLDVRRWGQAMSLVMPQMMQPAMAGAPAAAPGTMVGPQGAVAPQGVGPGGQPVGWAPRPGQGWAPGTAPGAGPRTVPGSGQYFCPRDGMVWSQPSIHPHYRCPRCNSPVNRM